MFTNLIVQLERNSQRTTLLKSELGKTLHLAYLLSVVYFDVPCIPKERNIIIKHKFVSNSSLGNAFAVGGLMNQADELTAKVKGSFDKRVFEDNAFLVVRGSGNAGDQFIAAKLTRKGELS
jgi:hypothetical protein